MKLYSYFRSSAAYRVRIACHLLGISPKLVPVHLVKNEQKTPAYQAINPQKLVPALTLDAGEVINQSLAIIEYLDETHGQSTLLPKEPLAKARVRAISQLIAGDIHPVNNLRVLGYLTQTLGVTEVQKKAWYQHWINEGFMALEQYLAQPQTGLFCQGDMPTMADCCLVPQVFNALRFEVDMQDFPRIMTIYERCMAMPEFIAASPSQQPDAQ